METSTAKLLQHANQLITLGRLETALGCYLKLQQMEPEDTTIVNMIGDLCARLGRGDEALLWYLRLAQLFEDRALIPNAIASYRKVLKLFPKNFDVMLNLARLYERQGQVVEAQLQYKMIAKYQLDLGKNDDALATYRKICRMDAKSPAAHLQLAEALALESKVEEAADCYLTAATLMVRQGNTAGAASVAETILNLKPKQQDFLKVFFRLLQDVGRTERGVEYLQSLPVDHDAEFCTLMGEALLQAGRCKDAQKYLLEAIPKKADAYSLALKLLQTFIDVQDISGSLDLAERLIESASTKEDCERLGLMVESIIILDESNTRALQALTSLLIRTKDRRSELGDYLKKMAVLELQQGNVPAACEILERMVTHAYDSIYAEVLRHLKKLESDKTSPEKQAAIEEALVALQHGTWENTEEPLSSLGLALGVSDLDLGMGMAGEIQEDFIVEVP